MTWEDKTKMIILLNNEIRTTNFHLTKKVDYNDNIEYTTKTHITYTPCYVSF